MNELRLEPDAIPLTDEHGAVLWAACVNVFCADDTPGNLVIGRERFPSEAAARLGALDLLAAQRSRIEYVYQEI